MVTYGYIHTSRQQVRVEAGSDPRPSAGEFGKAVHPLSRNRRIASNARRTTGRLMKQRTTEITTITPQINRVANSGNERCSQVPSPTALLSQYHPVRKNVPAKATLLSQ